MQVLDLDRSQYVKDTTNAADDSLKFHEENTSVEPNAASYTNRINQLYSFRKNIQNLINKDGLGPSTDYNKFLRLKAIDALDNDVSPSEISTSVSSPITASTLSDADAEAIADAVQSMQSSEFIQLFLDSYMSPIGSDIDYRLGKVVGIKEYLYNDHGYIYKDFKNFGQYDEYGRIDTTLNLRLKTDIPGMGKKTTWSIQPGKGWVSRSFYTVPPYSEEYVNFFFPPYSNKSFSDTASLSTNVDEYIKTRKWDSINKKWVYKDDFDPDSVTFDTAKLLSLRKNPTYRLPAYKAINDNISFLQHIFEQCTGIVSTYLTEWDISLYIQEGLLSGKENKAPSFLSMTNRMLKDNPSGYGDTRAYVYGALNAAVSKTPMEGPIPNRSYWEPSAYPYSVYWMNYKSDDRGDGLDIFYDVALDGFNSSRLSVFQRGDGQYYSANTYDNLTFREKIMRDDQMGAAFSGWFNWDSLYYWQALYTTPDDGLSHVDVVHMGIDEYSSKFEDSLDEKGESIDGVITQIISALYAENDELGFEKSEYDEVQKLPDGSKITTTYRKRKRPPYIEKVSTVVTDANGVAIDTDVGADGIDMKEDSDYKILGIRIKGSRILKMFLNRSSKIEAAMNIAAKEKNKNYPTANSTSNGNNSSIFGNSGTNDKNTSSTGMNNMGSSIVSMVDADANENGKFARDTGISQWTPALYGGPHGRHYSPKTVEGFFEENNEFLRNVPRINADSLSMSSVKQNFSGVESRYSPTGDKVNSADPYRSPSRCMSFLQQGYCDYTLQAVYCLMRHYIWSRTPNGYINGSWYSKIGTGFGYETYGTGYRTPIAFMCNPYSSDYYPNCPHYYYNSYYEWNNWNRYAHYYGGNQYWSSWNWQWYQSNWQNSYNLSYRKDYWGQLRNICIHSSERLGNSRSINKHYHGTVGVYQIIARRAVYMYYCSYTKWETYYMKRPLMHSNPNASNSSLWTISEGYRYNSVFSKWYDDHWWWRYWSKVVNGLPVRYSPISSHKNALEISMAYKRHNGYKLTFPLSGVAYHNCTSYGSCDIRYKEDLKFMEYVTGNSQTGWHNVYMFQSAPGTKFNDRRQNGPNLIFQVPVRRNTYPCTFTEWYLVKHSHNCHTDWCWHKRNVIGTIPFIEVDMKNVKQVLSGFKEGGVGGAKPWGNIDTLIRAGSEQEPNIDVPKGTSSKTYLPNSPFGYSTFPVYEGLPTQTWAGIPRDTNEFIMFGWGYATAFPGTEYSVPVPSGNIMENPNEYMNLRKKYGDKITNVSMQEMSSYYPFYTLDNNYPLRYVAPPGVGSQHNYISSQGIKQYTTISYKDPGIKKMLRNLFATSTFFKFVENGKDLSEYLKPYIVTNDVGVRALIRTVNHQLAWLKKAKQIFVNDIDWRELRIMIESTVNKSILSKSIPTSPSYDKTSVFYHYWIDKAYSIFGDDNNKKNVESSFNRKIDTLQTFLNSMSKYLNVTSYSWNYNDYVYIYNKIKELKMSTVDYVKENGRRDYDVEEFMYAYLNVLYEYRKFYINVRCNKVDGTLYKMRSLEGAIPLVCQQIQKFNPAGPGRTPSIFDTNCHTYKVAFYGIDNSNVQKIKTITDDNLQLQQDRTMLLYIKVNYVDESVALDYLNKCKDGTVSPLDQRYIWVPQKQRYAELPFDDTYRYESKEFTLNESAKKFNEKANASSKRIVRNDIDTCIFDIQWADNKIFKRLESNDLTTSEKKALRKNLGTGDNYPLVYTKLTDWESKANIRENSAPLPMIKFDVQSGIDPSKLIESQKALQGKNKDSYSALDIMCTIGSKIDYWVVPIPVSERPRAVGYVSNLKIKSYRDYSTDTEKLDKTTVAAAGAFGYSLYPITEEQANTIPGIGLSMAGIQENFKNTYLTNIEDNLENLDIVD